MRAPGGRPLRGTMRYEYTLPDEVGDGEVADALCRQFPLRDLGGQRWEVCYFDTFDWRLFAKGYVLEEHRSGATRYLQWRGLKPDAPERVLPDTRVPHFAHELPPSVFRDRLAQCTEPRALLPQAIIHTQTQALKLENEEGKTLLRVVLETGRVLDCHGEPSAPVVSRRVRLLPLRGYEQSCRSVRRAVEKLGLQPASRDMLLDTLAFSGREPGSYATRPNVRLCSSQRTDDAAKALLEGSLRLMHANLPGIRARTDPEFLHDFRTSVRRARALLVELDGVFPKRVLGRLRRDLKWLGEITGSARDLDVLLLSFDDYQRALGSSAADALEPCRAFVSRELETAYEVLGQRLGGIRFQRLLQAMEEFVESPSPRRTPLENAMLDVKAFADARLWSRFAKLRKAANRVREDDPAEVYHRCRILAKRARYLLDAFASLYPKSRARELRRRLKAVQDVLGEHHDQYVHQQAMASLVERMRLEDALDGPTRAAVASLSARMTSRQGELAARALPLLHDFAHADTTRICKQLFRPVP
jgi:CHAD domain-containing protein